ncbi:RHS repeat-associated core domain-containing protein, partial [Chitinimonas sp.]|uniref:RHS repeat-associated core domain-containing protein n=1 Tax=Chitinimonas sp. TaxID=1934313 RepID=UPI002F931E57
MNKPLNRLAKAVSLAMLAGAVPLSVQAASGTCNPKNGISTIGVEVAALSDDYGDGTFDYGYAIVLCSGGRITTLVDTTAQGRVTDMASTVKAYNGRYYANGCNTHHVSVHKNFKGIINGADFSTGTPPGSIPGMLWYDDAHAKCGSGSGDVKGDDNYGSNLGPVCQPAPNAPAAANCGNPIQPATGNKYQAETDYLGSGASRLRVVRHYNSFSGAWVDENVKTILKLAVPTGPLPGSEDVVLNGPQGGGGTTPPAGGNPNFGKGRGNAGVDLGPTLQVSRGTGQIVSFPLAGGADLAGLGYTLAVSGTGSQLTTPDNAVESYNADGKLTSRRELDGYTLTYAYDGNGRLSTVTDRDGRVLTYGYDAQGRVNQITDPALHTISYSYDAQSRLSTVTYQDNKTRTYVYENASFPNALTGIVDEGNVRYATFAYDAQGLAISTEHAGGVDKYVVSYPDATHSTVTNPGGLSLAIEQQNARGRAVTKSVTESCDGCTTTTQQFELGSDALLAKVVNRNGVATLIQNDATSRNELQRTEAANTSVQRVTQYEWHPTLHLPSRITEPTRRTDLSYDANGNLTVRKVTDLASGNSRSWQYGYDGANRLASSTDPANHTTQYSYDAAGNVATSTDATGLVTRYTSYDNHGRPLSITAPDGVVTTLSYDDRGRLLSRKVGALTTGYAYTATGLLSRTTQPDGSTLDLSYDAAHRLTGLKDKAGNQVVYTLDAAGNRTKIEVLNAGGQVVQTTTQTFDARGRLVQRTGANNQITAFGYDGEGNLTQVIDPLNHAMQYGYDALGRLNRQVDPLSQTTQLGYDALDQLTSVTDPRNLVTSYGYNALGDMLQLQSPDTGTSSRSYHANGLLATGTDAKNQQLSYQYDNAGRLLSIGYPSGSGATLTYGQTGTGAGKLSSLTDEGGVVSYSYDAQGRLAGESHTFSAKTYATQYGYDAGGHLSSVTYPSGRIVSYGYNANGEVSQVSTQLGAVSSTVLSSIAYRPFGQPQSWTFGNGEVRSSSYDLDGRLTEYSLGDSTVTLGYDTAGRITSQQIAGGWWQRLLQRVGLPAGQQTDYGYDNADRLTHWQEGSNSQDYGYDANGNRTQLTVNGTGYTQTVAATSNRVTATAGPTANSYQYDANGSRTSDNATSYTYDVRGRLVQAGGASYIVNSLGQRIAKQYGGQTTVYHYDQGGRLIAESDAQGNLKREYLYLQNTPVAIVDFGTELRYVHSDHLGTARLVTDAAKQAIWAWQGEPFGSTEPNGDPEGTNAPYTLNLRFPGQYYDQETGLYYNYYRDYDAKLGRYVQSDPIGLAGGINTYAYVTGNPLKLIDPKGLNGILPAPIPLPIPPSK